MKKKILALVLCAVMAATAVVGGTLAYFTDTDEDINVMTTGNISIVQNEHQRNKDTGELEVFADDKPLYPATGDANKDGKIDNYVDDIEGKKFTDDANNEQTIDTHNNTAKMFSLSNNAVDKIVTVTNTCDLPVYVRTLFAFELPADENGDPIFVINSDSDMALHTVWKGNDEGKSIQLWENDWTFKGADGNWYLVGEYYYSDNSKLEKKGDVTHHSLAQVYLSAKADNEDAAALLGSDGEYTIKVLSQATQVAGFENVTAKEALDTAFGAITADTVGNTVKGWFDAVEATPVTPAP